MICNKCGKNNQKGSNFCDACGSKLYTNNDETNNVNKGKSKKLIILVILFYILSPILIIGSIYIISMVYQKQEEKEFQTKIDEYQEKVGDYLKVKYQKEFSIEFSSSDYKAKEFQIDSSSGGRCGHDKNIKQYVYLVISNEDNVQFYVTVWENLTTNEYEINEINGSISNTSDTSYEKYSEINKEINELVPNIENIINKYYSNYKIEKDISKSIIKINFNSNISKEIEYNYNTFEELSTLDYNLVEINMYYNDYTYTGFTRSRDVLIIKDYFGYASEIKNYLDNNFNLNYSINYSGEKSYEIIIPVNIKDEFSKGNQEKYILLYNWLTKYDRMGCYDGRCIFFNIVIKFNDYDVNVSKYDTLENNSKKWN